MQIGYQASHEQFAPGRLLRCAQLAEQAGFDFVNASDHFHPWSERAEACGFVWSWLGAAMETTKLPFSVVTAPGQRYHPAVIAQAAATLDDMYPDRLTLMLGSGELLNEGITGGDWPVHDTRHLRLREAAEVMRLLWAGETVSHDGLVRIREARLFTLPGKPLPLFSAALLQETADGAGFWADGLVTTMRPAEELRKLIDGFRSNGGEGLPVAVKVDIAWGDDESGALQAAWEQWRATTVGRRLVENLRTPADFDAATAAVRPEDMRPTVKTGRPDAHLRWMEELRDLGVDQVIVHDVTKEQEHFIEQFAAEVIEKLERGA